MAQKGLIKHISEMCNLSPSSVLESLMISQASVAFSPSEHESSPTGEVDPPTLSEY
jgi:hypothetical protein